MWGFWTRRHHMAPRCRAYVEMVYFDVFQRSSDVTSNHHKPIPAWNEGGCMSETCRWSLSACLYESPALCARAKLPHVGIDGAPSTPSTIHQYPSISDVRGSMPRPGHGSFLSFHFSPGWYAPPGHVLHLQDPCIGRTKVVSAPSKAVNDIVDYTGSMKDQCLWNLCHQQIAVSFSSVAFHLSLTCWIFGEQPSCFLLRCLSVGSKFL
mmetsp:Transcript_26994/g.65579  ORF Transcript_26994/g.65579 Transcript_26994/m.65579 type:complete len:208 (+) Transcript_26994:1495-2118(+)